MYCTTTRVQHNEDVLDDVYDCLRQSCTLPSSLRSFNCPGITISYQTGQDQGFWWLLLRPSQSMICLQSSSPQFYSDHCLLKQLLSVISMASYLDQRTLKKWSQCHWSSVVEVHHWYQLMRQALLCGWYSQDKRWIPIGEQHLTRYMSAPADLCPDKLGPLVRERSPLWPVLCQDNSYNNYYKMASHGATYYNMTSSHLL